MNSLRSLWRRHAPAVVLVTHDVDEAILLADRVLVLSDGAIAVDVKTGIDRPRDRNDPRFARLRAELLAKLGVGARRPSTDTPNPASGDNA